MKFEDVMILVNAGFTAEQIAAMASDPKQDPKQDPEPSIADIMLEMKEIRKDMQKMALLGTNQKYDKTENVDNILAAIINPQQNQEDK